MKVSSQRPIRSEAHADAFVRGDCPGQTSVGGVVGGAGEMPAINRIRVERAERRASGRQDESISWRNASISAASATQFGFSAR